MGRGKGGGCTKMLRRNQRTRRSVHEINATIKSTFLDEVSGLKNLEKAVEELERHEKYVQHLVNKNEASEAKTIQQYLDEKRAELDAAIPTTPFRNVKQELDAGPSSAVVVEKKPINVDIMRPEPKKSSLSRFFDAMKKKFTKSESKVKNKMTNDDKKNKTKSEGQLADKKQMDTFSAEVAAGGDLSDQEEPADYPEPSKPDILSTEDKEKALDAYVELFVEKTMADAMRMASTKLSKDTTVLSKDKNEQKLFDQVDAFVQRTIHEALRVVKQEHADEIAEMDNPRIVIGIRSMSFDGSLNEVDQVCDKNSLEQALDELLRERYFAKKDPVANFNPRYVD